MSAVLLGKTLATAGPAARRRQESCFQKDQKHGEQPPAPPRGKGGQHSPQQLAAQSGPRATDSNVLLETEFS